MFYSWIKVLHVISIISWMAGLLYLPRIFIYHTLNKENQSITVIFQIMERRLYKYIMSPAMIASWLTGLFMGLYSGYWVQFWFLAKFSLILAMTFVHFYLGYRVRLFQIARYDKSDRYYRVLNEVPTLLMIFIVGLVILKPDF